MGWLRSCCCLFLNASANNKQFLGSAYGAAGEEYLLLAACLAGVGWLAEETGAAKQGGEQAGAAENGRPWVAAAGGGAADGRASEVFTSTTSSRRASTPAPPVRL